MLGQIDFAPWQCLAGLIDNSIDAFIDQSRQGTGAVEPKVYIDVPNERELKAGNGALFVRDNGKGMSLETLQDAVRAGYSGNDPVEKMGLFGMGFNISTARMGRRTEVWTTRADDSDWTGLVIDFDQLERQKTFSAPIQQRPKTAQEIEDRCHGTEIKITRLEADRVMPLIKGVGKRRTRDKLGKIYGQVMHRLDIKINYAGDTVTPTKHCVWNSNRFVETKAFGKVPARIEIDETLDNRKQRGSSLARGDFTGESTWRNPGGRTAPKQRVETGWTRSFCRARLRCGRKISHDILSCGSRQERAGNDPRTDLFLYSESCGSRI